MNTTVFNMLALCALGALLMILGPIRHAADFFVHAQPLEKQAYIVEGVEDGHGGSHGGGTETVVEEVPLAALLAAATPEAGAKVIKKCVSCHTFDQGGGAKTGPNLWNIVGAPFGRTADFNYSGVIKDAGAAGRVWDFDELAAYLENPKAHLPGNRMSFAGLRRPKDRAAALIYLRSLSEAPVPLPDVPAAPEEAPAEGESQG